MKLNLEEEDLQQLKGICAKYLALGYTTLKFVYSGSGDSGEVEDQLATNSEELDDDYTESVELDASEKQFFDYNFIDRVMEETGVSGYENNDGGQGVIFFDLTSGKVRIDHEQNVIETVDESHELDVFEDEPAA